MAITLVGSTTAQAGPGPHGALTFDISGMGVQEDDLLVALCIESGSNTWASETGWTDFPNVASQGQVSRRLYYKLSGVSEGNPAFDAGSAFTGNYGIIAAFRGVDTTTPVEASTVGTEGESNSPNPPSVTTLTDGAWVVALESNDDNDNTSGSPYPTGYTGIQYGDQTDGGGPGGGMAYKEIATAGAENPGTFSIANTEEWITDSLALKPASTGVTLTADAGAFTLSGQAAAFKTDRTLAAAAGAFALAGQAAGLTVGRAVVAETGSFDLGGQAAILTFQPVVPAVPPDTHDGGARIVDTRKRERAEEEARRERDAREAERRRIIDRVFREVIDGLPPELAADPDLVEQAVAEELARQGLRSPVKDVAVLIGAMRAADRRAIARRNDDALALLLLAS